MTLDRAKLRAAAQEEEKRFPTHIYRTSLRVPTTQVEFIGG